MEWIYHKVSLNHKVLLKILSLIFIIIWMNSVLSLIGIIQPYNGGSSKYIYVHPLGIRIRIYPQYPWVVVKDKLYFREHKTRIPCDNRCGTRNILSWWKVIQLSKGIDFVSILRNATVKQHTNKANPSPPKIYRPSLNPKVREYTI